MHGPLNIEQHAKGAIGTVGCYAGVRRIRDAMSRPQARANHPK
jgi:hypothetical protein